MDADLGPSARVFLLSPANSRGARGSNLLEARTHELARRLRSRDGAPLGELYSHISALYFRGKLQYARRFARPPLTSRASTAPGVHVITPNAGLLDPDRAITLAAFRRLAAGDIDADNPSYRRPLERAARALRAETGSSDIVLLGSIASRKYVDVLLDVFGSRLLFPSAFVGRGDMSRGGLMLHHVAIGIELEYIPVLGAVRHGARPPRLGTRPVDV